MYLNIAVAKWRSHTLKCSASITNSESICYVPMWTVLRGNSLCEKASYRTACVIETIYIEKEIKDIPVYARAWQIYYRNKYIVYYVNVIYVYHSVFSRVYTYFFFKSITCYFNPLHKVGRLPFHLGNYTPVHRHVCR